MEEINILLLEDDNGEITNFKNSGLRLGGENNVKFLFDNYKLLSDEVFRKILEKKYDFLIIDLKLEDGTTDGGNNFIKIIKDKLHIPIIINSANLNDLSSDIVENPLIKQFDSSNTSTDDIINYVISMYNTGITKVLGIGGEIENVLNSLIWQGGLDNICEWTKFNNLELSKKSLSRYILSHLHHKLSGDYEDFHPEENYIRLNNINVDDNNEINEIKGNSAKIKELKNILKNYYSTGTIVEKSGIFYVVLNPSCDISNSKQDKFLLAQIDDFNTESIKLKLKFDEMIEAKNMYDSSNSPENKKFMKEKSLSYSNYYRDEYLKQNHKNIFVLFNSKLFEGGYVNFRKLYRVEIQDIINFIPKYQISLLFLKDLISEFGYYYSRQGQPNVNNDLIIKNLP